MLWPQLCINVGSSHHKKATLFCLSLKMHITSTHVLSVTSEQPLGPVLVSSQCYGRITAPPPDTLPPVVHKSMGQWPVLILADPADKVAGGAQWWRYSYQTGELRPAGDWLALSRVADW